VREIAYNTAPVYAYLTMSRKSLQDPFFAMRDIVRKERMYVNPNAGADSYTSYG